MNKSKIAFTSGCFDAGPHEGHLHLLREIRKISDLTWVALNSDAYIRRKKHRNPQVAWEKRASNLYSTGLVDWVIWFDDDGPLEQILKLRPDFIVVGDDYSMDQVVGAKESAEWGCKMVLVPRLPGFSTTEILKSKENT